jgi:hypothetical protein
MTVEYDGVAETEMITLLLIIPSRKGNWVWDEEWLLPTWGHMFRAQTDAAFPDVIPATGTRGDVWTLCHLLLVC